MIDQAYLGASLYSEYEELISRESLWKGVQVSATECVRAGLDAVASDRACVIPNPHLAAAVVISLTAPFFILRKLLAARPRTFDHGHDNPARQTEHREPR